MVILPLLSEFVLIPVLLCDCLIKPCPHRACTHCKLAQARPILYAGPTGRPCARTRNHVITPRAAQCRLEYTVAYANCKPHCGRPANSSAMARPVCLAGTLLLATLLCCGEVCCRAAARNKAATLGMLGKDGRLGEDPEVNYDAVSCCSVIVPVWFQYSRTHALYYAYTSQHKYVTRRHVNAAS